MSDVDREDRSPGQPPDETVSGIPASPFDALAENYDAWFDGEGKLIFDIEAAALREVLPSLPKRWLEIGVGSGRFADSLGIETGLDPSVRMVELARRRGVAAMLGRGERLPFADGSFGAVFLIATLSFVEWPLSVLRETHRVLVPTGKLVLGVIPKGSPWGRRYEAEGQQDHPWYERANFRSHSELINLMERGDYCVEQIVSTLTQRPGEVARYEPPVGGYELEAGFVVMVVGKLPPG